MHVLGCEQVNVSVVGAAQQLTAFHVPRLYLTVSLGLAFLALLM